jgi:hypothetical protein
MERTKNNRPRREARYAAEDAVNSFDLRRLLNEAFQGRSIDSYVRISEEIERAVAQAIENVLVKRGL